MPTDALWGELETLAGTMHRLESELIRCHGRSEYRNSLEADIADVDRRRGEIVAQLQKLGPK